MKVLAVHPGPLMYTKIFCGSSRWGWSWSPPRRARPATTVRLIDLQVEDHRAFLRLVSEWRPE